MTSPSPGPSADPLPSASSPPPPLPARLAPSLAPTTAAKGHQDQNPEHDHDSPVETYLTALRRRTRSLAIGPYLLPLAHLRADISRLHSAYTGQAPDAGYPAFLRIWTQSNFALVHLGTPVPFGRDVWLNAWYALLLEHAASADIMAVVFAVYATVTLWRTQPSHLGDKVPVPITPEGLEALVERIDEVVRAGEREHVSDVVEVLRFAIQNNMFTLTAWIGGGGNDDSEHQPVPSADNHRWMQGVAGDGWTRLLALTRHTPTATASSSTPSAAAAAPSTARTGMSYIRHALQHHARTPLLPASTLTRLTMHAQTYAAQRDPLVHLGVLAPPATPAPRAVPGAAHEDHDAAHAPVIAPHMTRFVGQVQQAVARYHGERAARLRDAVDQIRRVGARKRKEQDVAVGSAGTITGTNRPPGRGFRPPPVVAENKGGRPNDVTRWAAGRSEDESRAMTMEDQDEDEDGMQVDTQ